MISQFSALKGVSQNMTGCHIQAATPAETSTPMYTFTLLFAAFNHLYLPCSEALDSWENRVRVGGRSPGEIEGQRWSCWPEECLRVSCTAGPYWEWSWGPMGWAAHLESVHCPAGGGWNIRQKQPQRSNKDIDCTWTRVMSCQGSKSLQKNTNVMFPLGLSILTR